MKAVEKGGEQEYIKKPSKSDVTNKDSLFGQNSEHTCSKCKYHLDSKCYRLATMPPRDTNADDEEVPEWCPERPEFDWISNGGAAYKLKFPYHEELCDGCWSDRDNTSLACDECQAYVSRPMDPSVGECPYKSTKPYGRKLPQLNFQDDIMPKVTQRFAEIVARGVNEGIMAYWGCHSYAWDYELGNDLSNGEFYKWFILHYPDHGFRLIVEGKNDKNSIQRIYEGPVSKAIIEDNFLCLSHGECKIKIEITDPEEKPDLGEEIIEECDDGCCSCGVEHPKATVSLERWC